jgi:hypothetical protein
LDALGLSGDRSLCLTAECFKRFFDANGCDVLVERTLSLAGVA